MTIHERSTAALEISFKDEDDALIAVGSMVSFLWEVNSPKAGATNPVATGSTLPVANPHLLVLDLSAVDMDDVGDRLHVSFKLVYNSTTLGSGAVLRGGNHILYLKNSEISA